MMVSFLALTTLAAAAAPRGGEPGGSALLATPARRAAAAGVAHRPALGARRGATIPDGRREQARYADAGGRRLSATDRAWYADAVQPMDCAVMGTGPLQVRDSPLSYANALYKDNSATLDDLRKAVNALEETERTARRVFGGEHPTTEIVGRSLRNARAALRTRETPPPGR